MKPEYGKEIKETIAVEEDSGQNGRQGSGAAGKESSVEIEDLLGVKSAKKFLKRLKKKNISVGKIRKQLEYEKNLEKLQIELLKLQRSVRDEGRRVLILFDGPYASGKGGAIKKFMEHLSPGEVRLAALSEPTEEEAGQWYFQRFVKQLPNRGEMVFFHRSWYNRAVIEPVNGFCTQEQYAQFMDQVPEFEHMICEDGIDLVKFWFSISKEEQANRFKSMKKNPLKPRKPSAVASSSQELWDEYRRYEETMFSRTHTTFSPWVIIRAKNRRKARLESIRYVLANLKYKGKKKAGISLVPDPNTVHRFHRSVVSLD